MLPFPVLEGLVLRRVAAYMGLALHEMPGGSALLKLRNASLYVISLSLLTDKRISNLTQFSLRYLQLKHLVKEGS